MTRLQLQARVLDSVDGGALTLATQFTYWLDSILKKIESAGKWTFLETDAATWQTTDSSDSATLASLSITNFSKDMSVSSNAKPFSLVKVPIDTIKGMGGITGYPYVFAIYKASIYISPKPVTGSLPILTPRYYKTMTLPTADEDVIEDVTGLRSEWLQYLQEGVEGLGFAKVRDSRAVEYIERFNKEYLPLMLQEDSDQYVETQNPEPNSGSNRRRGD